MSHYSLRSQNQSEWRSRCLEVGRRVEKKYFPEQQPTETTNHNAWKEAADVCFPQMSHFFSERGLSWNSIQSWFSMSRSLSRTICVWRMWGLDNAEGFFSFSLKGFYGDWCSAKHSCLHDFHRKHFPGPCAFKDTSVSTCFSFFLSFNYLLFLSDRHCITNL